MWRDWSNTGEDLEGEGSAWVRQGLASLCFGGQHLIGCKSNISVARQWNFETVPMGRKPVAEQSSSKWFLWWIQLAHYGLRNKNIQKKKKEMVVDCDNQTFHLFTLFLILFFLCNLPFSWKLHFMTPYIPSPPYTGKSTRPRMSQSEHPNTWSQGYSGRYMTESRLITTFPVI